MEENKDYHAYRYGDHLTPGSELKIEHSVVCENVDISTLITMGIDTLLSESYQFSTAAYLCLWRSKI